MIWGSQDDQEDWLSSTLHYVDSVLVDHHTQVGSSASLSKEEQQECTEDDMTIWGTRMMIRTGMRGLT